MMPSSPLPTVAPRLPRARQSAAVLLAAAAVFATTSRLEAHDFWLVPGAFPFAAGAPVEVLGQTSTRFPTSQAPVALARVTRAVMIGPAGETPITDVSHRGTSLLLRAQPSTPGERVIAVDLQPRSARQTPDGLLRYLRLEGAPEAADRIAHAGTLAGVDSLTRTDAKYAKTLVEVGAGGPRAYTRSAGQPLEFVPQQDPAALRDGDTLHLRLLFRGRPVGGVAARAGLAPPDSATRADPDVHLTSDAQGVLHLPVTHAGLWNVRTVHVVQAGPAAWETHWATFVFRAGR